MLDFQTNTIRPSNNRHQEFFLWGGTCPGHVQWGTPMAKDPGSWCAGAQSSSRSLMGTAPFPAARMIMRMCWPPCNSLVSRRRHPSRRCWRVPGTLFSLQAAMRQRLFTSELDRHFFHGFWLVPTDKNWRLRQAYCRGNALLGYVDMEGDRLIAMQASKVRPAASPWKSAVQVCWLPWLNRVDELQALCAGKQYSSRQQSC